MEVAPLSMIIESSQNFRYVTDFTEKIADRFLVVNLNLLFLILKVSIIFVFRCYLLFNFMFSCPITDTGL